MKNHLHHSVTAAIYSASRPMAFLFAGALAALPAQAIVHLNHNPASPAAYASKPTTAPANTMPWENVGTFTNATATTKQGSLVYLKGKYCLTANHVGVTGYVTFDGITPYAVDSTFSPIKIGTADVKLVKLVEVPSGLPELNIVDFEHTRHSLYSPIYYAGWGQGNDPSQSAPDTNVLGDKIWRWGGSSTKRWGSNNIISVAPSPTPTPGYNYSYEAIYTHLEYLDVEPSEAGTAAGDSGAPAFTYHNGQWYLIGIAGAAATGSTSIFGTPWSLSGSNVWVNLYELRDDILALIPAEPDVSTFAGWLEANGLSGADAAIDADPDGDGIANLSEFAFGTSPGERDGSKAPGLHPKTGGGTVFRYQLSKVATGISVDVVHSSDIINWSPAPGTAAVVEDTPEYTVYELEVFPSPTAERFYTITVTLDD